MPRLLPFVFACLGLVCAACQRTPLLETKVEAGNSHAFSRWQTQHREEFSAAAWSEWEAALQDIKVRIIALREASGTEAVNEALLPKVDGRTVRAVLRQGWEARLWRLNVEREELEKNIAGNSTLRTNPGDTESATYLQRKLQEQKARLERAKADIAQAEARLKELAAPAATR
jgi:hypothetical protein